MATQVTQQIEAGLIDCLSDSVSSNRFTILQESLTRISGADDIKRTSLDTAFRNVITLQFTNAAHKSQPDLLLCKKIVDLSIQAARGLLCSPTVPILVLADSFDLITLDNCRELFPCVEDNVKIWTHELFFSSIKNTLLRMCNDLLRRLSRTQNTAFCGRIMLFLAKFFPFSDRSGLNVISEFNLDNITTFSENSDAFDDGRKDSVVIEEDCQNLNIDYALYRKFWQLQDFFRSPNQCYTKLKWKTFTTFSNDIFNTFKSFKLDSSVAGKALSAPRSDRKCTADKRGDQFFAKYLTNQNLLQLQLSDSNFRRYVLIQFIILFQYLKTTVKFKGEADILTDEQSKWIESSSERIYDLVSETPPDGKAFAHAIEHIIKREEQWNIWKNEGCKPFAAKLDKSSVTSAEPGWNMSVRKRKAHLGDQILEARKSKKFLMGNDHLTELWNLYPDNMDACSAEERDFLPSMDSYFEEAIEELNPDNQIEDEFRKVSNGSWGWRALRLLAKKSPHFFTYGNNPIARLPDYLEQMLKKINSSLTTKEDGTAVEKKESNGSDASSSRLNIVDDNSLEALANQFDSNWVKLVPKLGLTSEVQEKITKEYDSDQGRALAVLKQWKINEQEEATKEELRYILEGLKLKMLGNGILYPSADTV